ncbi:MAG: endonuclease [Prevotellaceae bacterium]|nr:endonuclease [Prevotellaceae bacterium]
MPIINSIRKILLIFAFSTGFFNIIFAQNEFKIMSYNVENLFDTKDDSLYNDREYLPGEMRGWNYTRYKQKLSNIAKVIAAVGEWNAPALVGLCEIENDNVLYDLTQHTGLQQLNYKFIHYDSPDARGVDVALLYLPEKFKPINSRPINVKFPNSNGTTRDILYACGTVAGGDTLHIFVNHFPSRLGGELESEERRVAAAQILRSNVDSVFAVNQNAAVVIMGDFNDYPDDNSIVKTLNVSALPENYEKIVAQNLYNLAYKIHFEGKIGTYLHNNSWGMLDQIIVSGALLNNSLKISVLPETFTVFAPEWLLEEDKLVGLRPFRTYIGMKFNGGFSDHLPIVVKFFSTQITQIKRINTDN